MSESKINWLTYPSATSHLTTELNSLANAGRKLGASVSSTRDQYMDVELNVATQGSARSAGAVVELYLLPSVDGTNYAYGADGGPDPAGTHLVGLFQLDAATTARLDNVIGIFVPAGAWKLMVINRTGQAFASSANTLKYTLYDDVIQAQA